MKKFCCLVLALLLLVITPVSADLVLDEEFTEVEFAGGTRGSNITDNSPSTPLIRPVDTIIFADIERHGDISYISLMLQNQDKLGNIEEGRSERTYTLGNHQDMVIVRVKHIRNLLGQVTATIFDIYPQNWNIEGLSGKQSMIISPALAPEYIGTYSEDWVNDLAWPGSGGRTIKGRGMSGFKGGYTIVVSSINEWKNHLTVESTDNG